MPRIYIYPKLPAKGYGLCNLLFVWARASVAAKEHSIPMIAPTWSRLLRIGPWIRMEKYKRYYFRDFTNEGYIKSENRIKLLIMARRYKETELKAALSQNDKRSAIVVFEGMEGYFRPFLEERKYILHQLEAIVAPGIIAQCRKDRGKYIGVHIRRGDFSRIGQAIPLQWYIKVSRKVRERYGEELKIRIYSDAKPAEIREVLCLPNCIIMPKAPAIQDLLTLSNSEVIVGTSLSTFSLWASFLRKRPTVWPPVSPGVYGYGLHTDNHISSDWDGNLIYGKAFY